MALLHADDQWRPYSLAPIRTTASSTCTHASDKEAYHVSNGGGQELPLAVASAASALASSSSSSPKEAGCPSSSCNKVKYRCLRRLLGDCFSNCMRPLCTCSSTPPRSTCTPTRRRKRFCSWRYSLAFLFPAADGRVQSFYSSTPTAKASFPRTPSGKLQDQYFMSPRGALILTSQLSSGGFSTPAAPSSSKVQHFSGAIPSPRSTHPLRSPGSTTAGRKKPSFSLVMPPAMMMDKKNGVQLDMQEPRSPHVTCIGRVRRQGTHCKKLLPSDAINPKSCTRNDTKAQRRGTNNKLLLQRSLSDTPPEHKSDFSGINGQSQTADQSSIDNTDAQRPATLEYSCTQSFGKNKLLNLQKLQGHRHANYNDVLFQVNNPHSLEGTTLGKDDRLRHDVASPYSHDMEPALCMADDGGVSGRCDDGGSGGGDDTRCECQL